ncbi:hypothetical protein FHT40_005422 [Mycolicibacterium sp. BK556]|uniref:hypothetical protein n=1 Tax=Mycobacteriaceae TaxID=1762 RepID=UPI00105C39C1|nr:MULTISPECIES: hypothetical protein [Mycobacteriaceae]MBB3605735.1 hypothetical protein [Mycolicibacterium sp. BK556]MBB3635768.1 hypothetical protein [Mycolicibacterium sp. BK607]MBB3753184.1 hypothetical protein [Mycolicibacterium sp. BK634]TDO09052.1 hypothetical protein EV580_5085 [Mycobacterium sp. BK086]
MSRISKLFAANAIAAAGLCSAALALSPSAAADPGVSPAVPGVPALNMFQQLLTNPAAAAGVLQSAATALSGASALTGAPSTLPVSPIGGAPATLPVSPIGGVPATAPVAAPAPAAASSIAGPIIPLLNQLGVPGDLASLTPSNVPFPVKVGDNLSVGAPAPVAPVATGVAGPAGVPPASAPVAPTTPGGAGIGQLLPLSALP